MPTNQRLKLLNVTPQMIDWIKEGDSSLAHNMKIKVAQNWCENGKEVLDLVQEKIKDDLGIQQWMFYLAILPNENLLVGNGGFKGYPKNGIVEIGYEIAPSHRKKGLASELVIGLTKIAFGSQMVSKVIAHTKDQTNASSRVLIKCGFTYTARSYQSKDVLLSKFTKHRI